LSRARFSNTHPKILSQNQVEEAALEEAIALVGAPALVMGGPGVEPQTSSPACGKLHEAFSLAFQEDRHAWLATLG
jgi:hypothetical protein